MQTAEHPQAPPRCCAAVIVAAGRSERFAGQCPKPFVELAGQSLLQRCVDAFASSDRIATITVVVPAEYLAQASQLVSCASRPLSFCAGGATRADSVARGVEKTPAELPWIAIHDGARPLVNRTLIDRVIDAAHRHGAALPTVPVVDTVKRVADGQLVGTVDRAGLVVAQTPQVFRRQLWLDAEQCAKTSGQHYTDDAQLIEAIGQSVVAVAGDPDNFKVTLSEDLARAERLLRARSPLLPRIGQGYDVHRRIEQRPLVLGGVTLADSWGLEGHSDADVLCHAIGDALLGAAALDDLGAHFPPGDAAYQGISSLELLRRIAALLDEKGFQIGNLDATVVCQAPRLLPHRSAMRQNIAGALALGLEQVSVKATTTEGLGFAGRGEGIAAYATAALYPRR